MPWYKTNTQTDEHTFIGGLGGDSLRRFARLTGPKLIVGNDTELIGSIGLQCLHYKPCLWLLYNWQPLNQSFLQLLHLHNGGSHDPRGGVMVTW